MKRSNQLVNKQLVQHLDKLNELSDSVASLLQIDREIHTLWVSVKKNRLLLMTDDSSFATQLRFQQALIQQYINQKFLIKLKGVKIKVIAATPQAYEQVKEKCFRMSLQNASVLSYMAEDIDDDEVRESLRRLGGNT